ncbi:MAG: DivIVA domain-containing protein, partial [Carnobacterium jeotgali]
LRPAEEEALNIPTLKEILSVSQSKDNAEVVEETPEVSDVDSENNYEEEQDSIEGTLPAIELPK